MDLPKAFTGAKLDAAEIDSWIFSMNLYFAALNVTGNARTMRAALNLSDEAAVWLRAQEFDLATITWPEFAERLRGAFRPADWQQRARDQLSRCVMKESVSGYTFAFRKALLRCTDVSPQEALYRYVNGLQANVR